MISAKHANIETVFCATVNINRNLVVVLTPMKDASKEELRVAAQLVSKAVDAHVEFTHSKTNPTPPNSSLQANFHAVAVAHCDSQARTIHLIHLPATSNINTSLNNLGEDVLIKKANFTLELTQKEDDGAPC